MLRSPTAIVLNTAFTLIAITAVAVSTADAKQNERDVVSLYGKGVHAYFDGEYDTAKQLLDQAIEHGTSDPRAYYFRGLTMFEMDLIDEARADFLAAAEMEIAGTPQFYPVNRSLERIQGDNRQLLEETREYARNMAAERLRIYLEARYEALRIAEAIVLRKPYTLPASVPDVDLTQVPNLPFPAVNR